MARSRNYFTLVAALPQLEPLLTAKQTPLSRIRLEQRLRMLAPADAATLARIEDLLQWDRVPMTRTDEQIRAQAKQVLPTLDNRLLREIAVWRLETRTVVAALRRRRRGESAPGARVPWGYGRWVDHIRRYWSEPRFRLETVYPWLVEVHRLFEAGEVAALEEALLANAWNYLGRTGQGHYFDFEAVVIYVLRWDMLARWTGYDDAAAAARFNEMVEHALGERTAVFA